MFHLIMSTYDLPPTPWVLSNDFLGIAVANKLMPLAELITVNVIQTHAYRFCFNQKQKWNLVRVKHKLAYMGNITNVLILFHTELQNHCDTLAYVKKNIKYEVFSEGTA